MLTLTCLISCICFIFLQLFPIFGCFCPLERKIIIINLTNPTAPRRRTNRVENKTLLYLANVFAKIWTFSEKTKSGFVHYKYMRIFLCDIQIILEYHSLENCWWGWLAKFWLAFNHLHDISNIRTKFDNNRSTSFEDYVSNKNGYRQDRRKRGPLFLYRGSNET